MNSFILLAQLKFRVKFNAGSNGSKLLSKFNALSSHLTSLIAEYFDQTIDIPEPLSQTEQLQYINTITKAFESCNYEQQQVLAIAVECLITYATTHSLTQGISIQGQAGTGKSYIMKVITIICQFLGLKY